jgi:hypothetical protein
VSWNLPLCFPEQNKQPYEPAVLAEKKYLKRRRRADMKVTTKNGHMGGNKKGGKLKNGSTL